MIKEKYGPKFRRIRKQMNISLIEASTGVVSKSALARWETGSGDLAWEKVLQLLSKNHIHPVEFINGSDFSVLELNIQEIIDAYTNKHVVHLKNYALAACESLHLNSDSKKALFKAAIACNYYQKLTNKKISPKRVQIKIKLYFAHIVADHNYWSYENIYLLGKTALLLDAKSIYKFSFHLIDFINENQLNKHSWYSDVLESLLEADFALMIMDFAYAQKLLKAIRTVEFPDSKPVIKLKIQFLTGIATIYQKREC